MDRAAGLVEQLIRRSLEHLAEEETEIDVEAHHQVALEAARRSIVLLENDGILPLAEGAEGALADSVDGAQDALPGTADAAIAVIGDFAQTPRYQGAGSSHVNPTRLTCALGAIRELTGTEVPFARGFVPGQEADPALRRGPRLFHVPPPRRAARCWCSWGWEAGGQTVADVLFGRANPSSRLAETIPLRLEDIPSHLHFPGEGSRVRYGEGQFVGYRGFDALGTEVAYPFGHGLSYTSFEVTGLEVTADDGDREGLAATDTVTNTGRSAGRAVAQA